MELEESKTEQIRDWIKKWRAAGHAKLTEEERQILISMGETFERKRNLKVPKSAVDRFNESLSLTQDNIMISHNQKQK